jgi:cell division protein FtsB
LSWHFEAHRRRRRVFFFVLAFVVVFVLVFLVFKVLVGTVTVDRFVALPVIVIVLLMPVS